MINYDLLSDVPKESLDLLALPGMKDEFVTALALDVDVTPDQWSEVEHELLVWIREDTSRSPDSTLRRLWIVYYMGRLQKVRTLIMEQKKATYAG